MANNSISIGGHIGGPYGGINTTRINTTRIKMLSEYSDQPPEWWKTVTVEIGNRRKVTIGSVRIDEAYFQNTEITNIGNVDEISSTVVIKETAKDIIFRRITILEHISYGAHTMVTVIPKELRELIIAADNNDIHQIKKKVKEMKGVSPYLYDNIITNTTTKKKQTLKWLCTNHNSQLVSRYSKKHLGEPLPLGIVCWLITARSHPPSDYAERGMHCKTKDICHLTILAALGIQEGRGTEQRLKRWIIRRGR